jgi:murein DD-endopeptidase MepM/ murein hydrolase activator NlpD
MKRLLFTLPLLILVASGCKQAPQPPNSNTSTQTNTITQAPSPTPQQPNEASEPQTKFISPISKASERVTKKPFGIKISPQNSPVKPERFSGYHNAVDYEILPGEENADVTISAVCDGKLVVKRTATGYGGVMVQSCTLDGNPVTIIYGHMRLASISKKVGDTITKGEALGVLGSGYSKETDGERKHLHLGIHRGSSINIAGYVQTEAALKDWIDIRTIVQ